MISGRGRSPRGLITLLEIVGSVPEITAYCRFWLLVLLLEWGRGYYVPTRSCSFISHFYIYMKIDRKAVYNKYGWLCAYTWKPLGDDWQVDHIRPKWTFWCRTKTEDYHLMNHPDNLLPAIRRVNHYKRDYDLEWFRKYMLRFHERLRKLPKKTKVERTKKRIEYIYHIAELFDITPEKPFSWVFYFEI